MKEKEIERLNQLLANKQSRFYCRIMYGTKNRDGSIDFGIKTYMNPIKLKGNKNGK